MSSPLVSVICLCYNHDKFVEESMRSVLNQTYPNIELIVVDDCSNDESQQVIEKFTRKNKGIKALLLDNNVGNCRAFNQALTMAKGEFIIDLAADDILLPDRVKLGVETFLKYGIDYMVNFTNAQIINEQGDMLKYFYPVDDQGCARDAVADGDLYSILIKRFVICPPTMMMKKAILDEIGGYDETLAYEDFDFWIRSSRIAKYCYTDNVLVKKRIVEGSKSKKQYKKGSPQLRSTYSVCLKIKALNKTRQERIALRERAMYEMKQCLKLGEFSLFFKYIRFLI